jgi:protein gp37
MSADSGIEWTDATWNPVTGCTKVSPGCRFCYAERLTKRFSRGDFTEVTLHPERLDLPLRWRGPRMIFVNSMSDLFHDQVPFDFIDQVFAVMAQASHHLFQILTKRPDRLVAWHRVHSNGEAVPPHIWLGVSVESAGYAWRIDRLRQVDVPVRFISAEPLLGPLPSLDLTGIAWLISGGESGGTASRSLVERGPDGRWQPKHTAAQWVRDLRDQCRLAGVAFFHKQWGGPRPTSAGRLLDGREWSEYPSRAIDAVPGLPATKGAADDG